MSSIRVEFRESQNYEWSTRKEIGKGAFGSIFKGKTKANGEKIAVKCIKPRFYSGIDESERIELSGIIGKKHQNLAELIAIEQDIDRRHFVLIMELCKGPNMLEELCKQENVNGLNEMEFENVLKDLTNAIKFLRHHNIVHRNIKPANILKQTVTDGNVIYKLTDFGTIRLFQMEEQFSTLKGAEVYMDPKCIKKFIFGDETIIIDENIDLWSIGVTLYQLATGSLPFNFTNKMILYEFITQKDTGIIAGTNKSFHGNIESQNCLPDSCQLNRYLKRLLEQLLAGLLESESDVKWSYEHYFDYVFAMLGCEESSMSPMFGQKLNFFSSHHSTKTKPTSSAANDNGQAEGLCEDDEFRDELAKLEGLHRVSEVMMRTIIPAVSTITPFLTGSIRDYSSKRMIIDGARDTFNNFKEATQEAFGLSELDRKKRSPGHNLVQDLAFIASNRFLALASLLIGVGISELESENINDNHEDEDEDKK